MLLPSQKKNVRLQTEDSKRIYFYTEKIKLFLKNWKNSLISSILRKKVWNFFLKQNVFFFKFSFCRRDNLFGTDRVQHLGAKEVTWPPTTATEGRASQRDIPSPPWSPNTVQALWILLTSPIKLSIVAIDVGMGYGNRNGKWDRDLIRSDLGLCQNIC